MQRSSPSIANLSAALARAQIGLSNPEKSLVATIRLDGPGEAERSFRYASLASGLEIVRKALGEHEIATMQTTAIDQGAGTINLTTLLAHSSGEWITSDWPVCPVAESANPRRMGAALTYARRYALFTLVGIAGEDDLDAPDLGAPTTPRTDPKARPDDPAPRGNDQVNGHRLHSRPSRSWDHAKPMSPERSAALRGQLLIELQALASADEAAGWAKRVMGIKNNLVAADAASVEEAFQARLATLAALDVEAGPLSDGAAQQAATQEPSAAGVLNQAPRSRVRRAVNKRGIDKGTLSLPEPRRIRDRDHVKYVAMQPCLICGRQPCDAHHLRFAQSRALGRKVSDEFTVPLCRGHHRELHRYGDEAAWWRLVKVDPAAAAHGLWLKTHPLPPVRVAPIDARESETARPDLDETNPISAAASQ